MSARHYIVKCKSLEINVARFARIKMRLLVIFKHCELTFEVGHDLVGMLLQFIGVRS